MPQKKYSGIEWIGEIPDDWEMVLLSSIFHQHKEKNNHLQETNLLSLSYGKIIMKDIDTREGLLPASFDTYNVIDNGDIVFRLTDLQNDQRSLRTGLCTQKGIITSAYITLRKNVYLESRYMHYLFHSYDICKVFYGMGDGVRQGMSFDDLKKLLVLFPSVPKQQQIADFLDKKCTEIDRLIAHEEAMIEELKAYKQSVITEAVTKGLDRSVPMKDSGVEWIGEIPIHWSHEKLKFHIKIRNENIIDASDLDYIALENIESFSGKFIPSESQYDIFQSKMANAGDVLFGKLRPYLAKVYLLPKNAAVSAEFLVLSAITVNKVYLKWYLLSFGFIDIVNAATYGAKMPRANADFIKNSTLLLPSTDEQQQIAKYLDRKCGEIDRISSLKQEKIEELQDYKKSLIYEYVTGKKEVCG